MSNFTHSQKKEILQECFDGDKCCTSCGCEMVFPKYIDSTNIDKDYWRKDDAAQVDHIYPKSKGGKAELWNAQILCRKCNNNKKKANVTTTSYINYNTKNTTQGLANLVEACCAIL